MSSLARKNDIEEVQAVAVFFTDTQICLQLADGREVRTPIEFYPRLARASMEQRNKFELIGLGSGIHWPDLDEDLSVEGITMGRRSIDW